LDLDSHEQSSFLPKGETIDQILDAGLFSPTSSLHSPKTLYSSIDPSLWEKCYEDVSVYFTLRYTCWYSTFSSSWTGFSRETRRGVTSFQVTSISSFLSHPISYDFMSFWCLKGISQEKITECMKDTRDNRRSLDQRRSLHLSLHSCRFFFKRRLRQKTRKKWSLNVFFNTCS
jgi:hypothetical protein